MCGAESLSEAEMIPGTCASPTGDADVDGFGVALAPATIP